MVFLVNNETREREQQLLFIEKKSLNIFTYLLYGPWYLNMYGSTHNRYWALAAVSAFLLKY